MLTRNCNPRFLNLDESVTFASSPDSPPFSPPTGADLLALLPPPRQGLQTKVGEEGGGGQQERGGGGPGGQEGGSGSTSPGVKGGVGGGGGASLHLEGGSCPGFRERLDHALQVHPGPV